MKHYRQRANSDPVQAIELEQNITTELGRAFFKGTPGDVLVIDTVEGKQYLTVYDRDSFDEIFEPLDEQAEPETDDKTIRVSPDGDNHDICSEDKSDVRSEGELIDEEYNKQLESMSPDQPRKNPYTTINEQK